jgi:predicted XRE-type DNA-binding protein
MRSRFRKQPSHRSGSTNVYADLGYRAPESMLVKAQLVSRIAELLAERGMTQTQAATVLGIPQPKLSKMLRGQFRGFSERRLMDCLTQLGQDVQIVVRQRPDQRSTGAVSVTFA